MSLVEWIAAPKSKKKASQLEARRKQRERQNNQNRRVKGMAPTYSMRQPARKVPGYKPPQRRVRKDAMMRDKANLLVKKLQSQRYTDPRA